ncbi:MAG: GNAT family N-acetyltransferase [Burkholderiales bacterium]|nr:GNAT family N-acetyltransferase [Burkholderiales bacterium]
MQIIEITDATGCVVEPGWLSAAERVHRQLRPQIPEPYPASMERVFAGGGRMMVALYAGEVAGVAVYRVQENTSQGRRLYIDDLVVDADCRLRGLGGALLAQLDETARGAGCAVVDLDSGTQREGAHCFYFRAGYTIKTFGFKKTL